MKTQWFEIEIASTTYRTYQVKAESPDKANEIALAEMDADWEISKAWKQNAEVVYCQPQGGTSHMSDDEFGAYIRGE
jgi:putative hemolysin